MSESEVNHKQYLEYCNRLAACSIENAYYCNKLGCSGWTEYEVKEGNFTCQICDQINCMSCDAIHGSVSCATYKKSAETKSSEMVNKNKMTNLQKLTEIQRLDSVSYFRNWSVFDCCICLEDIPIGNGVVLRGCTHQYCLVCLKGYINECHEGLVKCPSKDCSAKLEDREIRGILGEELYKKYLFKCDRQAAGSTGKSVYCRTINCNGWALCEEAVDVFLCHSCNKENCLRCEAVHEDMSCEEYRKTPHYAAKEQDVDFVEGKIKRGEAMRCPGCYILIEKADGCDYVQCATCLMEICYITKQRRWGPKGKGDISQGCRCGVNNKKCHPNCGWCHGH